MLSSNLKAPNIIRSSKENSVARDYVLPDFTSLRRGFMKGRDESVGRPTAEGEQIIRMNNERFAVPELLFNPSDIGIEQEREVPISEMFKCWDNRRKETHFHTSTFELI